MLVHSLALNWFSINFFEFSLNLVFYYVPISINKDETHIYFFLTVSSFLIMNSWSLKRSR